MIRLIEVANLVKSYPNGVTANDNLNFSLNEGETVGLIGPNAAGKTTFIRQLLGLLRPTEGQITVLGQDIIRRPHAIKGLVAYVPQMPLSYPALSVEEVIGLVLQFRNYPSDKIKRKVQDTLELIGLQQSAKSAGYQLSGGSTKLVLLGMALCQDTPLLILDEPTAMVDVEKKSRIWEAIRGSQTKSILLASHDLKEVQDYCNRVYFILGGKFIAEGAPHEIAAMVKLPVLVSIVAENREIALGLMNASGADYRLTGENIEIVCENLSEGIKHMQDIESACGLRYVHIEAPSLDRAVKKMLETRGA